MRKLIIAIDGPVGSGKSSVARRVAALLGYTYLDTGAMYRAMALKALRTATPLDDVARLEALGDTTRIELAARDGGGQRVLVDGADVSSNIRTPEVAQATSKLAVIPEVRRIMVAEQRRAGHHGGVVMEGRDIGTVVFPDADLKIYLDASVEVRAHRRFQEHVARGEQMTLEQVIAELRERDERDMKRITSPLKAAPDAVLVDSTAMEQEEVARLIVLLAKEKSEGRIAKSEV
jgi:cytidylate kinase